MVALFHYLSLLNLVDAVVTYYGLQNAFITELNPMMDRLYQIHPVLFMAIKISLSVFLYIFIVFRRVPTSRMIKGMTTLASGFYTIVFALHCWWLFLTI
ncbi:DUF5658 family protein [Mesobacillus maritimus]|uniref:DUF5658 family protein n=1 Tax=Mesobacillus maritimus TaxID=1643336 RepID=UPI003D817E4F